MGGAQAASKAVSTSALSVAATVSGTCINTPGLLAPIPREGLRKFDGFFQT